MKKEFHFSHAQLQQWMQEAITLAEEALPMDVPVGALVINSSGSIIGRGFNTRERDNAPLGHAELNAIQQACQTLGTWRLLGCTLVVTLEPCPMCASALAQAKIERIVYGTDDPIQGACGGATGIQIHWPTVPHIIGGVLEEKTAQQLKHFFKTKRQ
jgi:tRNA(adenine34) deaminase